MTITLQEAINKLGDSSNLPDTERNSLEMVIRTALEENRKLREALEKLTTADSLSFWRENGNKSLSVLKYISSLARDALGVDMIEKVMK